MQRLSKGIGDKRLLRLINAYLKTGMMEGGILEQRTAGTPQGGPLSPLLCNIVLDELDKELKSRGHSFCRYADDCNIYVKSRKAGERVMKSVIDFIERKLKLKVNRTKSGVRHCSEVKFLGYTLLPEGGIRIEHPVYRTSGSHLIGSGGASCRRENFKLDTVQPAGVFAISVQLLLWNWVLSGFET